MNNLKKYDDFVVESFVTVEPVNESSIFDSMKGILAKISEMYTKPADLEKQMNQAAAKAGSAGTNVPSKSVRIGSTIMVQLVSPTDENVRSILSLTKLADLPDSSGLYQVSGSDNEEFLKSLGTTSISNLTIVGVLAIVEASGFRKDNPLTMRIYKNVLKSGKPTVTNGEVKIALSAEVVAKETPE